MKYIFLLLAMLVFYTSSAQDPQLFENTWYLQKISIESVDYEAPNNNEIDFISLNIYPDTFNTIVCQGLSGHDLTISNTEINVIEFVILPGDSCNLPENNDYEYLYYNGFFEWQSHDKTFLYTIEEVGETLSLVLTNDNGDKAFYGNERLGVFEFEKIQYSIHPNPVKNRLFLSSNANTGTLNIKIFNIEGKLLSTQNLKFETQAFVDVSNLASGIYFLNIEDENGNTTIKKFVKE